MVTWYGLHKMTTENIHVKTWILIFFEKWIQWILWNQFLTLYLSILSNLSGYNPPNIDTMFHMLSEPKRVSVVLVLSSEYNLSFAFNPVLNCKFSHVLSFYIVVNFKRVHKVRFALSKGWNILLNSYDI